MLIEPRQADRGALARWCTQALALILRGSAFWLAITLAFCLWMFLGQRFPLIDGALALTAFFSSIIIAERLDRAERVEFAQLANALRAHLRLIVVFSFAIASAGALIWMLLLARPGVPWWSALYSERNIVDSLSTDWLAALRQVFVYSGYALGPSYFGLNIPGLTSYFQFPLSALHGAAWRDAQRLSAAAQVQNLAGMLGLGILYVLLPVAAVLLLPPVVPVLYCFFGALCYVSYREIFLGRRDNLVQTEAVAAIRYHSPS